MNKTVQLPLFENDAMINDILVLISLPDEVSEYVSMLKKEIFTDFGDFESRTSKAHITVNNFLIAEKRMPPVFNEIRKSLSELNSFTLKLNGFSTFQNSQTLFINVEQSEGFNNLIVEFEELRKRVIKTKRFKHSKTPHVTIAKKVRLNTFKELKRKYIPLHFNHEFEVGSLTVLKYNLREKKYDHYSEINLKN